MTDDLRLRTFMTRNSWLRTGALIASLLASGCHGPIGELAGKASDEWVRSYELRPAGEIDVSATNGTIDLEGYDGKTVEVRAERTARAVSDEAARELVSKIEIKEEVSPDRVIIAPRASAALIGVSYQVSTTSARRTRSSPACASPTASSRPSAFPATWSPPAPTAGSWARSSAASSRPARPTARCGLRCGRSIPPVSPSGRRTDVDLSLPASAKADLSAECRNGAVSVEGLAIEAFGEQSRRSVHGKLNGGGAPIDVETTNGAVRIRALDR